MLQTSRFRSLAHFLSFSLHDLEVRHDLEVSCAVLAEQLVKDGDCLFLELFLVVLRGLAAWLLYLSSGGRGVFSATN